MKKYIKVILVCLLMLGSVIMGITAGSVQPQVNTVGLVLHYKMWDGLLTPTRVFDYTFKNAFGVINVEGNVSPQYPGLLFNEGYINASRGATDNIWDGGGTVSIWLKPEGQGGSNAGRVMDKSFNDTVGWLLYCRASDTLLRFIVIADSCDGAWDFPLDMVGNKWQHVVIVYNSDSRDNNPVVYVDGVSVTVTRIRIWSDGWDRTADGGAFLFLGAKATGDKYWDGSMDDAMLFDRSLKVDESRSIFESTRWRYAK